MLLFSLLGGKNKAFAHEANCWKSNMFEIPALLSGLFVDPSVLWLILSCVDGRNSDRSWFKLFFVSLGICGVIGVLCLWNPPQVAALFGGISVKIPIHTTAHVSNIMMTGLIISPIMTVLALRIFCNTVWLRAIITAVLFTIWLVVWQILGMSMLTKLAA